MSLTGLRYGELIALKYNDYDGKAVHITKTLDYTIRKNKPVATEPKNEYSRRTVSLPDRAIEIIEEIILENSLMKQTSKFYQEEDYIFTTMFGTPIYIGNINGLLRHAKGYTHLTKQMKSDLIDQLNKKISGA